MNNTSQIMEQPKQWLPLGWKFMYAYGVLFIGLSILVPIASYFSLPNQPMMTFAIGDERFTGLSWSQIMSARDNVKYALHSFLIILHSD